MSDQMDRHALPIGRNAPKKVSDEAREAQVLAVLTSRWQPAVQVYRAARMDFYAYQGAMHRLIASGLVESARGRRKALGRPAKLYRRRTAGERAA